MGISLNGLTPAGTYPGLIKTGDNTAISGTPKVLSDGNGNDLPMEVSTTGVNLTGSPTVNSVAIANTTQLATKQDTLVSGTNIKTINGTSVLGSGDIAVVTAPSGVAGAIQFSNGSAFASDAANLFWDDTNNRLGIGTTTPTSALHSTGVSRFVSVIIGQAAPTAISSTAGDVAINLSNASVGIGGFTTFTPSARVHIQGSGSTSATTSLLVQNSAGTEVMRVRDDGFILLSSNAQVNGNLDCQSTMFSFRLWGRGAGNLNLGTNGFGDAMTFASATGDATITTSLTLNSTTKGFLPPRMTTTQINAIASPANGLEVYNTTLNCPCFYNGTSWRQVTNSAM